MNKENSEFTVNTARDILKEMEISTVGDGKYIRKNISTEKVIFAMVEFSDRRNNTQSPLPESVEEPKDWTKPDENGDVDVPDYLMPLLNKLGFQLRFHTISGEGEAITLVRMTSIAEKFFKAHHSAEVERLRETLHKILRTPSKSDCDILASEALKEQ